ncbi:MAG: glycosyltransferase family 2 protein [bacterium]
MPKGIVAQSTEKVSVNILSTNERKHVSRCIDAILQQTYNNIELLVIDNGSTDGTAAFIQGVYKDKVKVIKSDINLGCAGGNNLGIKESKGKYIMPCDANLFMTSTYIEEMVKAIEKAKDIGMVQGKLLRIDQIDNNYIETKIIDSVGTYLTKDRRNFDRGQGEEDRGQYDQEHYIFGAGGACPLYKRQMLEDILVDGEYFDEEFFIYREEIDFNWRAQLFGWKCLYAPKAVAYHLRTYTREKRKKLPLFFRKLQYRNRYLMVYKNDDIINFFTALPYIVWFDVRALIYITLFEPQLLSTYYQLLTLYPYMKKKRRSIHKRRRVDKKEMKKWFHRTVDAGR